MVAILFASPALRALAAAPDEGGKRVVRVVFVETPGISERDAYGNRTGLFVDYLNEIAKYTNWEYEYIDTQAELMVDEFLEGTYELMGGTYYMPGFEKYFAYPDYNMGYSRAVLYCREEDQTLKSYDLESINGKVIGVFAPATERIRRLEEFLRINGLDCTIQSYDNAQMAAAGGTLFPYLTSGEVDLLLGNETELSQGARIVTTFDAQAYYIVTNAGNDEILAGLNMALQKIMDANPSFATERYDRNFQGRHNSQIPLSQEEQNYIDGKQSVSVAVVQDWHPFFCTETSKEPHEGIVQDLLNEVSDYTGLTFTYYSAGSYIDAVRAVKEGRADVLGCYLDSDQKAWENGLARTEPYAEINNIVLRHKTTDYPAPGLTCGIVEGRALPDNIEAASVRSYRTTEELMAAADRGDVDFIYCVAFSVEPILQAHRYTNLIQVPRINNSVGVALALARPADTTLLTILNKAIGSLSEQEKSTIMDRNMVSIGYSAYTLSDLIYDNPVAFVVLVGLFLALVTAVCLAVFRVKVKNALIQGELDRARAGSRAKSEFLSRMSHEIRTPMNAIVGLADLTSMKGELPPEAASNLQKIQASSQYLLSLINDILDMSRIENDKMEIEQEPLSLSWVLEELEGMMRTQSDQKKIDFKISRRVVHDRLLGDPVRLRQVLTNLLSNAIKFTPSGGRVLLQVEEQGDDGVSAAYFFSVSDNGIGIAAEDQERIFGSFEQVGPADNKNMGTGLGLPISRSIVRAMGGELRLKSALGRGAEFSFSIQLKLDTSPENKKAGQREGKSLIGLRALLAEDNDLNAEIAADLLEMQGISSERAVDGREALERFAASEPGHFQLILMDVRMPAMDGLEATRAIRACAHPDAKTIPIIAMTANSFKEDERAAFDAGMTGFLAKPVDADRLSQAIRDML